ncbi:MAG: addiction module toxin RelE [Bacteroidetes bacterium GWA2_32_17]|nr:MAG: addiction module toxin RelE [Bacteroidetes bacterium GWA2_32_17]
MRILSKKTLKEYWEKHRETEDQLASWYSETHQANWTNPKEIKEEYPKASIIGDNRVVFNICGNKYRLIVKINYERGWVFIRFIGAHTEYDKIKAETI